MATIAERKVGKMVTSTTPNDEYRDNFIQAHQILGAKVWAAYLECVEDIPDDVVDREPTKGELDKFVDCFRLQAGLPRKHTFDWKKNGERLLGFSGIVALGYMSWTSWKLFRGKR